jgi:predicted MFS family arabinose efflux permease
MPILYKPIVPLIGKEASLSIPTHLHGQRKRTFKNPFLIFRNLDIIMYLATSAITCTVFYGTLAPISSLFKRSYPFLTEIELGLCFLGMGFGMTLGSFTMGRILDSEYARFKRRLEAPATNEEAAPGDTTVSSLKEDFFPLELV